MEKVIQDSDDDDDDDEALSTTSMVDISLSANPFPVGRSTSLKDTRSDLWVRNGSLVFDPPASLSKRSKTMRTYGSVEKHTGDSTGLRRSLQREDVTVHTNDDGLWNLPGTLRDDFLQSREPMFTELSSTIPDNTMTQKRLVEQALESNKVASDKDTSQGSEALNSTITWSTSLGSQNRNEPTFRMQHEIGLELPSQQSTVSLNRSRITTTRIASSQSPTSSARCDDSPVKSQHSEGLPRTQNSTPEQAVRMLSEIEVEAPSKPDVPPNRLSDVQRRDLRKDRKSQTIQKDGTTSDDQWFEIPQEQYRPRPSRSRSSRVADIDQSHSPEAILRSRVKRRKTSHDLMDMPTSIKLDALVDMGFTSSHSQKALQYMGNDIEMAVNSLLMSKADTEKAEEKHSKNQLEQNDENEHNTIKGRSSTFIGVAIPSVKATCVEAKSKDYNERSAILNQAPKQELALQQVVPFPSKHEPVRPGRRHTTTAVEVGEHRAQKVVGLDEPDEDNSPAYVPQEDLGKDEVVIMQADDMSQDSHPPSLQKKRGRGRPRKTKPKRASEDRTTTTSSERAKTPVITVADIELSIQHDLVPVVAANVDAHMPLDVSPIEQEEDKTDDAIKLAPPSTPKTQGKTRDKRETVNHSPLSKGKVPYRVGLSRRHRIAPLLRMVKK